MIDLAQAKQIRSCLPFVEPDAGVNETMECMSGLIEEVESLRASLLAGPDKVIRCAFCGHEYPDGTPTLKSKALADHIRECPDHPVGQEVRRLRALVQNIKNACPPEAEPFTDDGPVCAECGTGVAVRPGHSFDPGDLCDNCAQAFVEEVRESLKIAKETQ